MAFTNFIPKFRSQEGQDAKSFKIWDESTWSGDEANCSQADLHLSYYNTYGKVLEGTVYPLIVGANRDKFNEYLSNDGHIVDIDDILPGQEMFQDGYYILTIIYDDGSYTESERPNYMEHQAFLAKLRCMSRKMPVAVIDWPEYDRTKILDTHVVTLLLDNAEDAADLGKRMLFEKIVRTLNRLFDQYKITGCF